MSISADEMQILKSRKSPNPPELFAKKQVIFQLKHLNISPASSWAPRDNPLRGAGGSIPLFAIHIYIFENKAEHVPLGEFQRRHKFCFPTRRFGSHGQFQCNVARAMARIYIHIRGHFGTKFSSQTWTDEGMTQNGIREERLSIAH